MTARYGPYRRHQGNAGARPYSRQPFLNGPQDHRPKGGHALARLQSFQTDVDIGLDVTRCRQQNGVSRNAPVEAQLDFLERGVTWATD